MTRLIKHLREDYPALILLTLILLTASGSVAISGWVDGLWLMTTVVLVAVAVGYLMAISRFSELTILLMSSVYGVAAVWLIVGTQLPESLSFRQRIIELGVRLVTWVTQVFGQGFSRDNLIFILILAFIFWFLAFNAVSNTFRTRHLWLATIPPGLVLLINNFFYVGEARLDMLLLGYMFLTFTLAVRMNIVIRERIWRSKRMTFTPGIRFDLLRSGVIAGVLLLVVAWSAPAANASNRLSSAWDQSGNPWHRFQDTMSRLFGGVEGGAAVSADYYGGAILSMGGPVSLGNTTVMYVYAPEGYHYYWRSKVFDTYNNGRWTSSSELRIQSDFGIVIPEEETVYALRTNVQQRFEMAIPASQLVYAAPQPQSFASLPVAYDVRFTQANTKEYAVVSTVRVQEMLRAGDSYNATSSISVADQASLRAAGTDYPDYIEERFLALPDTISERTYELAAEIAAEHDTPYDTARAIERFLRTRIAYNEQVPPPPRGAEPVDYVLFDSLEGYCNYYASSLAVMLRSQGIPARVVAGFVQGQFDEELKAYRVLESDAHSWVEVYFPGYGWIEFEPTASEIEIVRAEESINTNIDGFDILRDGNQSPDGGLLDENGQPIPDEGLNSEDAAAAEAELTLIQRIGQITIPPIFRWLVFLSILVLGGVAVTWFWVEQRGMGGLSPVSKSYARLGIFAPFIGVRLQHSDTPSERANNLVDRFPDGSQYVSQITDLYVEEQYARPKETEMHGDRANQHAIDAWGKLRSPIFRLAIVEQVRRLNPFKKKDKSGD